MARRGENIFKRKDGRWEARYIKERDAAGKSKLGYCYGKTYEEAKANVERRKAEIISINAAANTEKHTFSYYCNEWPEKIRGNVRESSYAKYKQIIRAHIEPELGGYLPEAVDSDKVQQFVAKLRSRGLAPRTTVNILTTLRSVLDYTAQNCQEALRYVEINWPKEYKREQRTLSHAEQKKLADYLLTDIDESKFGVLLALYTGMRLGELCALRWYNISLKERTIEVEASMQRVENTNRKENGGSKTVIVITPPMNDTSHRLIPLTDRAFALCKRMKPSNERAYVLTGTENSYTEPHTLQMRFKRYTQECGLEDVHFNMLRDTFAARCTEVGFEIKALSEVMGYSTANIPLGQYVFSSMDVKRSNMDKLSEAGM